MNPVVAEDFATCQLVLSKYEGAEAAPATIVSWELSMDEVRCSISDATSLSMLKETYR